MWYHAAAMLSCRSGGPGTVQYIRRDKSAKRVLDIVSQEGCDNLPPLPLVPYALSMATTVIVRSSLLDRERDTSTTCEHLRRCCEALDILSQRWTSAKGVAKLAHRLWKLIRSRAPPNACPGERRVGSTIEDDAGTSIDGCSPLTQSRRGHNLVSNVTLQHNPASIGGHVMPEETQIPYLDQTFQRQLTEAWPGIDASDFQIDWAFQDWFDYESPSNFSMMGGSFGV